MKNILLLTFLIGQFLVSFGQTDSLSIKENNSKNKFKYSVGIEAFMGPVSGFTPVKKNGPFGYNIYGSIQFSNHSISGGVIFAEKLSARYRSQWSQYPEITFKKSGINLKGGSLGYKFKPSLKGLHNLYFEYKFNIYQEHYMIKDEHTIWDEEFGMLIKGEYNESDNYATVINNSIGVGLHTNRNKHIEFYGGLAVVFVHNFSKDYEYWDGHNHLFHPASNAVFNPERYASISVKIGIAYNFHKRKNK